MTRGRKKETVVRWSKWADAQIWARVKFIQWRDGLDVRAAAKRLAEEGFFQVRGDKAWLTRGAAAGDSDAALLVQAHTTAGNFIRGDARNAGPEETFRQRYYAAIRRARKDAEFKADCAFWLRFLKENHGSDDEIEAFFAANEKQQRRLT